MLLRKIPVASSSKTAQAARGYRRFSRTPAERKTLIWKLNIVILYIWPVASALSIWQLDKAATDRRKSADRSDFLTYVLREVSGGCAPIDLSAAHS